MDVSEDVRGIMARLFKLEPGQLKADTQLSDLAVDSIDVVEMVFEFEEKFDISIGLEPKESSFTVKVRNGAEMQDVSFSTVGQIIETVQRIVDAKAN